MANILKRTGSDGAITYLVRVRFKGQDGFRHLQAQDRRPTLGASDRDGDPGPTVFQNSGGRAAHFGRSHRPL